MSCAAAIALCATAGAAAAETIVVRSSGPSARAYPPGKNIVAGARVALKAGDVVTILDGRGTRVFRGPGTFATTAATATSNSINQVLRNTGARQVRTGAVRGLGGATVETSRPPNVWLVDATKSGTVCYAGTEPVSLWMPGRPDAATVTLTRVADGKSVPLALRPGQTIKTWPEDFPVASGSEFRVSGASSAPVTVKFASLGANPQGLEGTAAALIKNGCNAQLDLLIETVAVPGSSDTPSG